MKGIAFVLLLALLAWHGYGKYQQMTSHREAAPQEFTAAALPDERPATRPERPETNPRCDGRLYCSQMTSCAEATWFLKNCPGVKMDGNNDGIPCERQWCK